MDTKEYIIDTAFKLFLSKNYEAVTMSELTKALNLSKGAIYHHFTNKEEIFKAVIDKHIASNYNEQVMPSDSKVIDYINSRLSKINDAIAKKNEYELIPLQIYRFMQEVDTHYPENREKAQKSYRYELEMFQNILENGIKSGEIKENIDCSSVSSIFFNIMIGFIPGMLIYNSFEEAAKKLNLQGLEFYNLIKR